MSTKNVTLNNPERFAGEHKIDKAKLQKAIDKAVAKLEKNAEKFGMGFPGTCTKEFRYELGENNNWESGMYTGCYWLAYELTGRSVFREIAEKHLPTYIKRFDEKIDMGSHDVGFVFSPSCVAQYMITGNEEAKKVSLDAALHLYDFSYSKKGGFIVRSAHRLPEEWACRTMMDSMLNAPLLYWAGKELGRQDLTDAAISQNDITDRLLLREDGSSYHHYQFDVDTHAPVKGLTFQGNADDSCWSRGHAWGIYGYPVGYDYTKDEKYVDIHKNITYFMLNHLPEDLIPYWDYDFTSGDEPRDSSAGAISACGMMEMARLLPDTAPEKKIYLNAASQMLEAIIDKCTDDEDSYDGLINLVTHAKPFNQGIDECAVYGDYFYLEALLRYTNPDWKRYW